MTTMKELPKAAMPHIAPAPIVSSIFKNRRCPGRPDQVSPHLILLLRTSAIEASATSIPADELPFEDALAPTKGIAVGLLLSVPVWAVIGGIIWTAL